MSQRRSLPEMVEDGVSGLVYPAGDALALASRIELLVNSPARAAELGRQALQQYRAICQIGSPSERSSFTATCAGSDVRDPAAGCKARESCPMPGCVLPAGTAQTPAPEAWS